MKAIWLSIALAFCGGVVPLAAQAVITHYQLNIPRQPLEGALKDFAHQTGLQIARFSDATDGSGVVGPIEGRYTAEEALKSLLAPIGLTYQLINERTIAVVKPGSSTSVRMPPVPQTSDNPETAEPAKAKRNWIERFLLAQNTPSPQSNSASPGEESSSVIEQSEIFTLTDVIVTAQKREQRLLDVPLSVTAITGADIQARGVSNLLEAQYAIPGLTLSEFGPGQQRAQLRGIGPGSGLPAVGFYLDEMPINVGAGAGPGGAGLDVRLLDMQRIEVLRGPQPTLYGEGSMGGTIRYITADPNLNEFAARLAGDWGAVQDGSSAYRAEGMLNVPLIEDKLGLRLAAGYENLGGWIDVRPTGAEDVNDATLTTFRAKLLFEPTDRLAISLLALHQAQDQAWQNFAAKDRTTTTVLGSRNDGRYDLANLIVSYDLGPSTLLGTVGYLENEVASGLDLSAFFVPLLEAFGFPPGLVTTAGTKVQGRTRMWTEELRLTSNGGGSFNYTLGAYYRDPSFDQGVEVITAPIPVDFGVTQATNVSEGLAVFGDASYAFTDRLEMLVGVRYFEDKQSVDQTLTLVGIPPITSVRAAKFHTTNPRINLSYKTSEDGLVYFNAAKGFRSGGVNSLAAGPMTEPTFGPEKLYSYELGTKQQWLERRLIIEAGVYFNTWEDYQALILVPGNFAAFVSNTGKASGPGADISLTARPSDHVTVSATVGYTDMEYDTDSLDRSKGDSLDLVVPWTYSAALDYRRPLTGDATLVARADFLHTDGYSITQRLPNPVFPNENVTRTGPRNVVNLRFGADFGKFEAYLFADNLTDDNGLIFPIAFSLREPVLPRPRTLGVELRVNFP